MNIQEKKKGPCREFTNDVGNGPDPTPPFLSRAMSAAFRELPGFYIQMGPWARTRHPPTHMHTHKQVQIPARLDFGGPQSSSFLS